MIGLAQRLIAGLHWADLEILVDLIFARSGWQRLSRVGGGQKDVDLIVREPITGLTASVQVKARAGRGEVAEFVERCGAPGLYDRLFFISGRPLAHPDPAPPNLQLWTGERLAEMAVRAGLYDWLMEKTA